MTCPVWRDYRGTVETCDGAVSAPVRWQSCQSTLYSSWEGLYWGEMPLIQGGVAYQSNHAYCGDVLMDLSGWYFAESDDPLQFVWITHPAAPEGSPFVLIAQADAPASWQCAVVLDGTTAWPFTLTVLDAYRCQVEFSVLPYGQRQTNRYSVALTATVSGVQYVLKFDFGYRYISWCC